MLIKFFRLTKNFTNELIIFALKNEYFLIRIMKNFYVLLFFYKGPQKFTNEMLQNKNEIINTKIIISVFASNSYV